MLKGPRGEKRPGDVIGAAIKVARIATGEEEDTLTTPESEGKDAAAVSMGKRGGAARAAKLTPEKRAEIAKAAATKPVFWSISARQLFALRKPES